LEYGFVAIETHPGSTIQVKKCEEMTLSDM